MAESRSSSNQRAEDSMPSISQTSSSSNTGEIEQTEGHQSEPQSHSETDARSTETVGDDSGDEEQPSIENGQQRQPVMHQDLWILQQQMRPDLADTKMRVNTFKDWPHGDSHPPERMAAAGFYYTGNGDLVRCFFCGIGLKLWENGDVPLVEHVRFAPDCPFIQALVHGHEQEQREINEVPDMDSPANGERVALKAPIQVADSAEEVSAPQSGSHQSIEEMARVKYEISRGGLPENGRKPVTESSGAERAVHSGEGQVQNQSTALSMACFQYSEQGLWVTGASPIQEQCGVAPQDNADESADNGLERCCLHCCKWEREVLLSCGHKNLCCSCFFCKQFWLHHLQDGPPRCLVCNEVIVAVFGIPWGFMNMQRSRFTRCGCNLLRG